MFLGFWSWVLVFIVVVAIFSADRLPELREFLQKMSKEGAEAVKKGKKELEGKIAQVKAAKEKKAKEKAAEEAEDSSDEQ